MTALKPLLTTLGGVFAISVILYASPAQANCTLPAVKLSGSFEKITCTADPKTLLASTATGKPLALLDGTGAVLADLSAYQAVLPMNFQANLLPVLKNNKVGYIDRQGRVIIGFDYDKMPTGDWARAASDERIITYANGRYVIISTIGRLIRTFAPSVSQIDDYQAGQASVIQDGQQFSIDKNGNKTSKKPLMMLVASTANVSSVSSQPPTKIAQAGTPTLPNISQTPIAGISQQRSNTRTLIKQQQNGKWGFVDEKGVLQVLYAFDEVRDYTEGLAAVRQGELWGFIDEKADLVIPFQFPQSGINQGIMPINPRESLKFEHGRAWVGSQTGGKKLCINIKAETVDCLVRY